MGFLDFLFGRRAASESAETRDSDFGTGVFENGHWTFLDAGTLGFVVVVDADADGPTNSQREFFRSLLARLPALEETARNRILAEAGSGITLPPLQVYSLHLGNEAATLRREFTLELSDSQALVVHRVRFQDDVAVSAEFDA